MFDSFFNFHRSNGMKQTNRKRKVSTVKIVFTPILVYFQLLNFFYLSFFFIPLLPYLFVLVRTKCRREQKETYFLYLFVRRNDDIM